MDNLSYLSAFVRAAETHSFVAAGRVLGVSASAVGKSVARLEERLGVRLFQRSTRRISLTAEGTLFYERCQRILGDIADAEAELERAVEAPRGRLRVSLPAAGHHLLLPVLPDFLRLYPEIEMDLDFNDRMVDVIAEGLDAVVRSGTMADSRLMGRRIGPFRFHIVGSPAYFEQRGLPQQPRDLEGHACLRYKHVNSGILQDWALQNDPATAPWRLPATFVCNNAEALIGAAQRGLGLAYLPDFLARDALATGTLRTVLDAYQAAPGMFWVLWPSSRHLSPKLRVFVDFLCTRLIPAEGPAAER